MKRGTSLTGRNLWTPNEIRIRGDIAEMDLYNRSNEVIFTTILDAEDVDERILGYRWGAAGRPKPYVLRHDPSEKSSSIFLARLLLAPIPVELIVDHINRDTLDNRKENLRLVTWQENNWNRGDKGVRLKPNGSWVATIQREFITEDGALHQRDVWVKARV